MMTLPMPWVTLLRSRAHSGWQQGVLTAIRWQDQLAAANGRALDGPWASCGSSGEAASLFQCALLFLPSPVMSWVALQTFVRLPSIFTAQCTCNAVQTVMSLRFARNLFFHLRAVSSDGRRDIFSETGRHCQDVQMSRHERSQDISD